MLKEFLEDILDYLEDNFNKIKENSPVSIGSGMNP